MVALLALLAFSAVAPSIAHFNHASATSTSDHIATGSWSQDQYDSIILQQAQAHNLDPFVVKAVIALESNFNTYAVSTIINSGCGYTHDLGLMQVNPVCSNTGSANLFDPWTNLSYGCSSLQEAFNTFGGNTALALMSYNIGIPQVQNGARNWAYADNVLNYVSQFENEHNSIYGSGNSQQQQQQQPNQQSSSSGTYTVQAGDTLYSISLKTGISWQTLAADNGISSPYIVQQGEVLQLSGSAQSYTVQSGNYLYQIAQSHGLSWQQIAWKNGIGSPYLIYPGQIIKL